MKRCNRRFVLAGLALLAVLTLALVGGMVVRVHALTAHEWTYTGPDNVATFAETTPHLTYSPDGTFTGSLGCNSISGKYVPDPLGSFHTILRAQTLGGCDELDSDLLLHFRIAGTGNGPELVFEDNGKVVARFERVG